MNKELTDKQIDEIVETAKTERENSEAIDMIKLKDEVEVNENAETEFNVKEGNIDSTLDLMTASVDSMPSKDVSLFDLNGDEIKEDIVELNTESLVSAAKDAYDLSDDDAIKIIDVVQNIRKNNKYPVYANLPESIKSVVRDLAAKNNIQPQYFNQLSRMIMMELMNDNELNSTFIDLEKALNEALNIPSILDLYSEHVKTVMEENIPKMVEEIKDIDPDKAKTLEDVKERFTLSYNFSLAKEKYETNSRLRKAMRRYDVELKRTLDRFNFMNEKSNFKMNDVRELPEVLKKVLIADISDLYLDENIDTEERQAELTDLQKRLYDLKIEKSEIYKFCIMIAKSCEDLNPKDMLDAVYMYYMMKNIIMLKYTKEAKTDFSVELINNICDTIVFIRDKEAELNAANMDKSKR